jgi:hypothetical protein
MLKLTHLHNILQQGYSSPPDPGLGRRFADRSAFSDTLPMHVTSENYSAASQMHSHGSLVPDFMVFFFDFRASRQMRVRC